MATPKHKTSKSRRDMRRSHDALGANAYHECPNCGEHLEFDIDECDEEGCDCGCHHCEEDK